MSRLLKKFAVIVAAVMMGAMMPLSAASRNWVDDDTNRGTEANPVNLYDANKWNPSAFPSSGDHLTFTAGGLTYITNTATTKIAKRLRFGGGDFVVLGPMQFNSFGYDFSETAPVSIDKRGDWSCDRDFQLATGANSSFAFTNRTGALNICSEQAARIGFGSNSEAKFVLEGGTVTGSGWYNLSVGYGTGSKAYFEQNGGTVSIIKSLNIGYNGAGELTINNGTFTVGNLIRLGDQGTDSSGNITLNGGTLETKRIECGSSSKGGTILFNGGTLKANGSDSAGLVSDDSDIKVQLGASGGTIDNNNNAITIPCTITGAGGLTLSGAGTTTVAADQFYTGATTVSSGTTIAVSGVTFAGSLALEAGSTLNIASYDGMTPPLTLTSLTLPAEGTVNLTLNSGAFSQGVYAICSAPGVAVEDGAKFTFTTEGDLVGNWSIEDDALVLTVGEILDNMWTGRGGDFRMSNGANWGGGEVPAAGEDIDFSGILANTTIIADADRTFGAVKMGADVITFTGSLSATSFISEETHNPTAKIAVGEDSTVTLVGDLVFATNRACVVCNTIAAGGTFAVTGDIIATDKQEGNVMPCNTSSNEGVISAKGLVCCNKSDAFALARTANNALAKWVIGEDGISGTKNFYVGTKNGTDSATAKITAATNLTFSADINQYSNLTLDPAGYEITLGTNTLAKSGGILSGRAKGLTTVTGTGKVVVNYNVEDLANQAQDRTNAFTVASSATLAFKPGANIGFGALTVQDGGTLEVAESGTVTHKGALTLDSGAVLAFNFTERGVVPRLALASGSPTVSGAVTVKVSSDNNLWPTCGEKLLTTCGGFCAEGVEVSLAAGAPEWAGGVSVNPDGNIVFCVKPKPTVIVIR